MSCERWEKHALGNWKVELTSKAMSNDFTISNPFPSFLFFKTFVYAINSVILYGPWRDVEPYLNLGCTFVVTGFFVCKLKLRRGKP